MSISLQNYEKALNWSTKNSKKLEFRLHSFIYLQKLKSNQQEAVDYARQNFIKFPEYAIEIQKLMCLLLFHHKPVNPYTTILKYSTLELQKDFSKEYCRLLGQPRDSPIFTCLSIGSSLFILI